MLHMRRAMLHEIRPMTKIGSQGAHLAIGSKRPGEQSQGVQLLEPLTVLHVGFTSWHMLDMAAIDQSELQAAGFQEFEDRNPIDAGGLHGDRIHLIRN